MLYSKFIYVITVREEDFQNKLSDSLKEELLLVFFLIQTSTLIKKETGFDLWGPISVCITPNYSLLLPSTFWTFPLTVTQCIVLSISVPAVISTVSGWLIVWPHTSLSPAWVLTFISALSYSYSNVTPCILWTKIPGLKTLLCLWITVLWQQSLVFHLACTTTST